MEIGDVRGACKQCSAYLKGCPGCIIGKGDINQHNTEEWNETCSTRCRDEEAAVGKLVQVSAYYWKKIE